MSGDTRQTRERAEVLVKKAREWADILERGSPGWLLFAERYPPDLRELAALVESLTRYGRRSGRGSSRGRLVTDPHAAITSWCGLGSECGYDEECDVHGLAAELALVRRQLEQTREQFAWIAREASGDCEPGRIIRACENALDALAAGPAEETNG